MKFPVFDLHCDTAFELLGRKNKPAKALRQNDLHIDLKRAGKLDGYAQCFACFTTPIFMEKPEVVFQNELETILAQIEQNADLIALAHTPEDIEENRLNGKMSAILTIEGPAGLGFDPAKLEDLANIGFRMSTLGWNENNPLTGSHKTGGGLTDQGREYVKEAQRLNMLIDVSHISDAGFWDIMNITQKPVIASHSNSRSVCNVSRNITDDMFRAICWTNGVVGMNLYSEFLGESADLDTVCDHILHFMELDPTGKHIALGGDLDGCETLPAGFVGIQDYNSLASRLLMRGLDESQVLDIFWNNALGVMKRCCI